MKRSGKEQGEEELHRGCSLNCMCRPSSVYICYQFKKVYICYCRHQGGQPIYQLVHRLSTRTQLDNMFLGVVQCIMRSQATNAKLSREACCWTVTYLPFQDPVVIL
jgi:hypothetical protein